MEELRSILEIKPYQDLPLTRGSFAIHSCGKIGLIGHSKCENWLFSGNVLHGKVNIGRFGQTYRYEVGDWAKIAPFILNGVCIIYRAPTSSRQTNVKRDALDHCLNAIWRYHVHSGLFQMLMWTRVRCVRCVSCVYPFPPNVCTCVRFKTNQARCVRKCIKARARNSWSPHLA